MAERERNVITTILFLLKSSVFKHFVCYLLYSKGNKDTFKILQTLRYNTPNKHLNFLLKSMNLII